MTPAVGYTEMRDSGFPDIGCVPSAWSIMKVKHIFDVICGATPKENPENWDGNIPWIGPSDMPMTGTIEHGKRFISELGYASCGTTLVPQNSIIISTRAPIGKICIAANRLCTNQGCKALVPRNKSINNRFFAYYLRSIIERLEVDGTGTTFKELSTSKLLNEPLIAPPISEQSAIAAYLDTQCAKIDEIIAEAKASIEDYKQWKASIIYEAVTKGLDPNAEMKDSGIEWIGEIPKEWLVTKMRKVASFYNGDRTSRYPKPDDFVVAGVPFINSTNLNGDTLNMTSCKYITEEKYNSLSGTKLRPNDIVYCLRGSVGKCAINTTLQRGTVASSLMSIRAERINPYFLLFVLLSDVISRQTGVYINGTCAANLSAENVGGFAVPFPPAQEQGQIAECLMRKGAMIDELIADKSKFIANLDTYKKSLIYEVVTGKRRVC